MKPQMNTDEHGWEKSAAFALSVFICVHLWFLSGCSTDNKKHPPATQPTGVRERQEAALKDPFGYSPNMERTDVSGGSISNYNRAEMRKDVNDVLNP
jgi:hypothetical protein